MNVDPYKSHMNYYRDLVSRHNSIKISEIIPPYEGMIYHYTSVNAFCSILESSKLRFTNKKYLTIQQREAIFLTYAKEKLKVFAENALKPKNNF